MLPVSAYERAERLLAHHRHELVAGGTVSPQWVDDGERFAYRLEGADHATLVDPSHRTKQRAPDDQQQPTNPMEVPSADRRWAVYLRDHNLWARNTTTSEEKALTTDGTEDRAYAIQPDALTYGVAMRKLGLPSLPPLVAWSSDNRRILTHRTDQRGVDTAHLIESSPDQGRSRLHTYRYAMPGDEALPKAELVVLDVETGELVEAKTEPLLMPLLSPLLFAKRAWCSADGSTVYFLEQPRDLKTLTLKRLDPVTGEVRTLVDETSEPRAEPSQDLSHTNVEVLANGRDVLWYTQCDGWGHLYLYDAESGALRNQVTKGDWAVQQILRVDEDERSVYFVANGLVAANPYRRQVCKANLDGSSFVQLTDDDLDHAVTVPPNAAYFVDSASAKDVPPVTTVRGWDGGVLVELERADITALEATGWTPPEQFRVKAADGTTDVYGLLYRPFDFDPERQYPVVDSPYPGPHHGRLTANFAGNPWLDCEVEAIASLGFAVVIVEGRGNPGRDRAFHDASYGHYDTAGYLEDHVAALRQLAETRPWLDLDRVGVYGDSGGGYATVRAMLRFPEFYKVGVASCGNHDQRYYQLAWGETYDGPYDEELYTRSSNAELADRLRGKLLLMHGELDDNVHPQLTLRLVDALIAANKDFELLIVPGAEHLFLGYEAYVKRRRWDFLVRHLLGEEPPAYRLADVPLDPSLFFGG